jgi:hypothetical protein
MRLVTLDCREVGGRPGIILPAGEILDLAAPSSGLGASRWRPHSAVSVLAEGEEGARRVASVVAECESATDGQRQQWRNSGRLLPAAGTRLLPPMRRPGLLLMVTDCDRATAYIKNPNAAVGPDASVEMPAGDDQELFITGMIGLVIGRPLFRGTPAQAGRCIAALTLVADLGSARLDRGTDKSRIDARQFPGACVVGPALVTSDEFSTSAAWELAIHVNGRAVAAGPASLTAERAAKLLAALSVRYTFGPGDVVGLPAGGAEFELPASSSVTLRMGSMPELRFSTGS